MQLWYSITLIKIPILQAMWWKAYLRFTPTQPHNVADNIFKCCWTLCWWYWGVFLCLLWANPQTLDSSRSFHPVPVCPKASMWVHRLLCQTVWDAVVKWDSWRAHISAEPLVFIPYLLNSSPWKQIFFFFFAFCVTPPHPLCSCRNLICRLALFLPQPPHFSIEHPPYQNPSQSISFEGRLQPPNPLFIRKGWSKSTFQLVPKASRLRWKTNGAFAFYE